MKKVRTRQEAREKAEKRSPRAIEEGEEDRTAKWYRMDAEDDSALPDVSSPGAASSGQAPVDTSVPTEKRLLKEEWNEDEAPEKAQKISSICVGYGASDKKGEVDAKDYEEDLVKMAEEYKARNEAGEYFVHIRRSIRAPRI